MAADLISAGIPTFIDGRGDLFGGEFIREYAEAIHLTGGEPNLLANMLEQERASQQAARPPAGLVPGLCRRQGDNLRARALVLSGLCGEVEEAIAALDPSGHAGADDDSGLREARLDRRLPWRIDRMNQRCRLLRTDGIL